MRETASHGHSRSSVVVPIDAAYKNYDFALGSQVLSVVSIGRANNRSKQLDARLAHCLFHV